MARPTHDQLSKLSFADLKAVRADVDELIKDAEAEARQAAKQRLMETAEEMGFSVQDLFGNAPPTKPISGIRSGDSGVSDEDKALTRKIKQEYAGQMISHPDNPDLTYRIGTKGRFPVWVIEAYRAGTIEAKPVPVAGEVQP